MPLPLITASAEELAALPMKEIKRILTERNISTKDIFEKVRIRFVVAGRKRWVGRRLLHSKRGAAVGDDSHQLPQHCPDTLSPEPCVGVLARPHGSWQGRRGACTLHMDTHHVAFLEIWSGAFA